MRERLRVGMFITRSVAVAALLFGLAASAGAQNAVFPFGVYDKTEMAPGTDAWAGHYRRLMALLADNNINTILTLPYRQADYTLSVMNEAERRGVYVIMGTGNPLNGQWDYAGPGYPFFPAYKHRNVIAFKYGDEPDDAADLKVLSDQYAMLRTHLRKPVVTALVGESMDFDAASFPHQMWSRLDTEVRLARHYPIRRTYDLRNWYRDKMKFPFDQWAALMESSEDSAWWCVLQTFGKGIESSEASFWRFPTAAELSAMMHIAVANGARGIIGYSLQDHDKHLQGLVDAQLQPRVARDGSVPLTEYRRFGAIVRQHAALLARHKRAEFSINTDSADIVAVPRVDPKSRTRYLYVVNKNTEVRVEATVSVSIPSALATDLYTGATPDVEAQDASSTTLRLQLQPGEGQLWRLQSGNGT